MTTGKKILTLTGALALIGGLALGSVALADDDSGKRQERHEARRAEILKKLDTNGDGKIDDAEREAFRHARLVERFRQADTNGDGKLTFEEFEKAAPMHRGGFHRKGMK